MLNVSNLIDFLVIRPSRLRIYAGKPDTFGEQVIRNFKTLAITATFREISEFNATIFSAEAIRHSISWPIEFTDRMNSLCQPRNPLLPLVRRSRCQMSERNPASSSQPSRDAQSRGHLFGISYPELFCNVAKAGELEAAIRCR